MTIILENTDPNFVVKNDFTILTENNEEINFYYNDLLEIINYNNNYYISNLLLLKEEDKIKFFSNLNKVSNIQLEELDTEDLESDGFFLNSYSEELLDDHKIFPILEEKDFIKNKEYKVINVIKS